MQAQALPGFREFYPEDAALRNHIFNVWRSVAARYGFEEYDGPPLEPLDLYTAKSGDEIVGQLYAFNDKGGRAITLRPEMTPTLARMVAARAAGLKKPIRWFSIPQLFRYERQQRGRLREHFQLNMDLIGEPGPLADAEIIAAALDVMGVLGLAPGAVQARVSDRRVLTALLRHAGIDEVTRPAAFAAIDKIERDPRDVLAGRLIEAGCSAGVAEAVLRIGAIRGPAELQQALTAVPDGTAAAVDLLACMHALEAMGFGDRAVIDLSIVRGLAYYTGVVFELFDSARTLRAICGGGRYDGLLGTLGAVDLPAVGFGMGDVVLSELVKAGGAVGAPEQRLDAFVVAVTPEDLDVVLALTHALRDRGAAVEFSLRAQGVGKQLKLAAARGARRAVIVGPDERAAGTAVVKDLDNGTEDRVTLAQLQDGFFDT
ncbi:MAG TPA: histidine--tRNA ligase [Gemmatimonadales bacterium]